MEHRAGRRAFGAAVLPRRQRHPIPFLHDDPFHPAGEKDMRMAPPMAGPLCVFRRAAPCADILPARCHA